jgi:NADH dehydrogenase FAD-containing subunit
VVGIELAGELAVKYGTDKVKKIGLCAKGQRLLPGLPQKASRLADEFLRRHNVEILYNTPFTATTAKEKGYEVVIECTGYKFYTDFMKKHFSDALAPNGQIFVNDLNQISGTDPRVNPIALGLKGNIFAFGDCTQTSLNENKGAMSMNFMMPFIINNLRQMSRGQRPSHTLPNRLHDFSMVSLGPTYGIMALNGLVIGNEGMAAAKFDLTDTYGRICKGDDRVRVSQNQNLAFIGKALGCINYCCCCCPCSILFTPTVKRHNKSKAE